jgi:hypothetical protein
MPEAAMSIAQVNRQPGPRLDGEGEAVIAQVERALADGLALLQWWRQTDAAGAYARCFPLVRTFNIPDESFAFFDQAQIRGRPLPVMGIVEDMLYDQPKQGSAESIRDELREFVLHYFLRISAFERPEAYADATTTAAPRLLPWLSWCPTYEAQKTGFGFSQHYFKPRDGGQVGAFPPEERWHIVDLREIGSRYDWIVVRVRIYDFNLTARPRGQEGVQLIVPLKEASYLVVSPEFLVNEDDPETGVLGRYGIGYAFIHDPFRTGPIAYGPGEFAASFQLIHFRVLDDGRIKVQLIFVANQPERVLDVPFAPFDWGLRLADLMSLGMASRFLAPLRYAAVRWPLALGSFDPVATFVGLANLLTGGAAASDYCISMEQLDRRFLVQHFMQHYQMVTGSLLTWRQHASWLDRGALPEEIVRGVST